MRCNKAQQRTVKAVTTIDEFEKYKMIDKSVVNPGFHKQFLLDRFGEDEQKILRKLSRSWYLTSSGEEISLAQSRYRYFLMKPVQKISEMFNVEREIVCIFSDYSNFEPRSLDIFDSVFKRLPKMRSETVCGILISKHANVEAKVEALLKSDPEYPIIVPFSYAEFGNDYQENIVENRFRKHFYSRDLFSFSSPLKKDVYFFGRNNLINEVVGRYKSGEHTSLFGLRKSGKTSIVYAVQRKLDLNGDLSLAIDCELPSIHMLRWNELVEKIVKIYHDLKQSKVKINYEGRYEEKNAADSFEEDILKIYNSKKNISTLFIFDEIERISPNTASSPHWTENSDFIFFWQTLRGFYQKHPGVFSYMLVGTNPSCVESPQLNGHENPIFASIPSQYVPSFTVDQVSEMVKKLGSYMGLVFDPLICSKLADDFGGHPFLIRQMCSLINKKIGNSRPYTVDKALYQEAMDDFYELSYEYLDMMVGVLREWYPAEYDMLTFLAQGDKESFEMFASDHVSYTRHLLGYGLITKNNSNKYAFNLEMISLHLSKVHANERLNLTNEEKVQEISARRNRLEKSLRILIKNSLRTSEGPKNAQGKVISALPQNRKDILSGLSLNEILDKDSSPLFFLELINIIKREWAVFSNVFELEKAKLIMMLEDINTFGRPDAHAKKISEDDFLQLRLHFKKIEPILDDWSV